MPEPRVGLIGAGPVGCWLASALAVNGRPAAWVVRDPVKREWLGRFVLEVDGALRALDLGMHRLLGAASELPGVDWLILAVKAQHVAPLLEELRPPPDSGVLVAANGLHEGCFHLGLLYGGAYLDPPRLVTGAEAKLLVGALPGTKERVAELVELLGAPWLAVGGHEEIVKRMWHKLVLNCVANPLSGLLDCINGKLLPHLEAPLVHGLLMEAERVARSVVGETWTYSGEALHAALRELLEATAGNSSSMREDLRAGRETEIERINLAVAATGRRLGLPCPLNEGLGRMVFLLAGQQRSV